MKISINHKMSLLCGAMSIAVMALTVPAHAQALSPDYFKREQQIALPQKSIYDLLDGGFKIIDVEINAKGSFVYFLEGKKVLYICEIEDKKERGLHGIPTVYSDCSKIYAE